MTIVRRHVLFLAGFDPIDVPSQHRRLRREAARFARTWSVTAEVSDLVDDRAGAHWRLAVRGPDWTCETLYEPLDWHDVVLDELARSRVRRLIDGCLTFLDFIASGAAARYFAATWRYGLFFLVPFLNVLLFAVCAVVGGWLLARALDIGGAAGAAVLVGGAAAIFAGLMQWPGQRWRVDQALADWVFARDYMRGRRGEFDRRLERFAGRLAEVARAGGCEEIIVVGHSLGATLAVDVIARALARDPMLAAHGPALCLLTVGATIPKLALHPAAAPLRQKLQTVAGHPDIAWTEYQARRDAISFYRFDPVRLEPFSANAPDKKPHIALVGLKDMLTPATYRRHKMNHMRLHYQFVMGNEQPAIYDYFMLIAGPAPFAFVSQLPKGMLDVFGVDGSFRVRPPSAAVRRKVQP